MKNGDSPLYSKSRSRWLLVLTMATLAVPVACGRFREQTSEPSATINQSPADASPQSPVVRGLDLIPPAAVVRRFVRAGTAVEMTVWPVDSSPDRPPGTLRA